MANYLIQDSMKADGRSISDRSVASQHTYAGYNAFIGRPEDRRANQLQKSF